MLADRGRRHDGGRQLPALALLRGGRFGEV
jgi:hypothetical protein